MGVALLPGRGGEADGLVPYAAGVYNRCMTYDEIRDEARAAGLTVERGRLEQALAAHGWGLRATARALETTPTTMQKALARHPDLAKKIAGKPGRPRSPE